MDAPDFLSPVRHVAPVQGAAAAPAGANPLAVTLEQQALSNWCWAAVTSAVEYFYGEAYAAEQCAVATTFLMTPCCPPGPDTQDNPQNSVYNVLTALGNNAASGGVLGPIAYSQFTAEIDAGRPACGIVDWDSGGSHVLLLAGYTTDGDIWIDDPASPGLRMLPWASFCALYGDDGHWNHTIKTKPSGA
jgi:hypothetical protein